MSAELRLSLLGGLQILLDEMPVTGLRTKKARALLCYLAVTGRECSRPSLAGLLWADTPEANALMNLRKAVSELRRAVPVHLTITRSTVSFNAETPHWLDVSAFENAVRPTASVASSGIGELETAVN
ncbi:MAG: hypothetical protein R3335_10705, partial [Anaerolineales bacterium]|nr:hypothetical protein [Anaerolineales bacterium]